jgi:cytochrome c553
VPLTGGTLLVTRDGTRAVVADPDRDRVTIVDLATEVVTTAIELDAGSEPGRVIEDGGGRLHVALRGSGQLLSITGSDRQLRAICGEPRGLAWQETSDLVHVACATGELVSVPAGGGDPVRSLRFERDLRDVIVRADGGLIVTTFRTANLLTLDAQGALVSRTQPPIVKRTEREGGGTLLAAGDIHDAVATVAWRTIALADGRLVMTHQRRVPMTLETLPGGYGGGCGTTPVETALTVVGTDGAMTAVAPATFGSLPIDVAQNPVSGELAIVTAGTDLVWIVPTTALARPDDDSCEPPSSLLDLSYAHTTTAVAYTPDGALLMFQPEASLLVLFRGGVNRELALVGERATDEGRTLFHTQTPAGISCASCHPEGRDDGSVWTFSELGPRRTQSLGGSLLSRAPYHWGADMASLHDLVGDVFAMRMGGGEVSDETKRALGAWLDRVPAPRGVVVDAAAVARGAELFDAPELGCRSCHTGELLTNNKLANVGTPAIVKVPSLLGVGARAPYMHDGCAATLRDRFGACGGGDNHGHTSQLTPAELDDLIAFLESL